MKRFFKIFKYIFLPFTSIFVFFLFLNILILDWNYAHKAQATYQDSFDWLSYKTKISILKTNHGLLLEADNQVGAVQL